MKTYLVTGASRGVGLHASLRLAERGARVLALARDADALAELGREAEALPGQVLALPFDLSRLEAESHGLLARLEGLAWLDGLLNNAGALRKAPFAEQPAGQARAIFETNYFAPALLTRLLLPRLRAAPEAHVLNIGSMGGVQGSAKFAGLNHYSASKAALACLTECLAAELAESRVRFNCLALGAVQTRMLEEAFPGFRAPVDAATMGRHVADFLMEGHRLYNGKILPVALGTP